MSILQKLINIEKSRGKWKRTVTEISAVTTPPTKGTTSVDRVIYIIRDNLLFMYFNYKQTGAGSSGEGDYLFRIPSPYIMNQDVISTDGYFVCGYGRIHDTAITSATAWTCSVIPHTSTQFKLLTDESTPRYASSAATAPIGGSNCHFMFYAVVPIVGG